MTEDDERIAATINAAIAGLDTATLAEIGREFVGMIEFYDRERGGATEQHYADRVVAAMAAVLIRGQRVRGGQRRG